MYAVTRGHGLDSKEICTITECMSVRLLYQFVIRNNAALEGGRGKLAGKASISLSQGKVKPQRDAVVKDLAVKK